MCSRVKGVLNLRKGKVFVLWVFYLAGIGWVESYFFLFVEMIAVVILAAVVVL